MRFRIRHCVMHRASPLEASYSIQLYNFKNDTICYSFNLGIIFISLSLLLLVQTGFCILLKETVQICIT